MAFTFSPTTERGKVRLLLYDTTDGTYKIDYNFSDADIDALLEQNSDSVWLAAADGCRSLAAKSALSSIVLKIPGAIEIDKKKVSGVLLALAEMYQARSDRSSDGLAEFIDSFDIDIDMLGEDSSEYVGDV